MTDRERRLTEENAVFEEPKSQPQTSSNDQKIEEDKATFGEDRAQNGGKPGLPGKGLGQQSTEEAGARS